MRVLILGFDAFDPFRFEELAGQGRLPNLTRYVETDGYRRLEVSNPPQTEVSWTSIATGLNPGGHGIFDFVHRNPATYSPYPSLLPTKSDMFGTRFVPPHKTRTIFEEATAQGYPATALWWPAMFPVRPELPVCTIPGLGTPDIQGRLGVGSLFTSNIESAGEARKVPIFALERLGRDRYRGFLKGPAKKKGKEAQRAEAQLELELSGDTTARLVIGKQSIQLAMGRWSPIVEIPFRLGALLKTTALTQFILTRTQPEIMLYVLPLQLHPLHSPWRYATPRSFIKQTWKDRGPFLTLGLPQDTTALEDKCITDAQFLELCESIFETRTRIFMYHLQPFQEGILASIFDSLDRVQHMFWRDRPDIVDQWYVKMDTFVGQVAQYLHDKGQERTRLLILSDHGFASFHHKVHLNAWLIENGYLITKSDDHSASLQDVDWSQSQAYAIGLNSLYVNLSGREGQGLVTPERYPALLEELRGKLSGWHGPDGQPVIRQVWRQDETFDGALSGYGPDLVIGYTPGYRASAETGLGQWKEPTIEPNHDHWGADHCIDVDSVPGVLFTNQDLSQYPNPSYRDIPTLTIGAELRQGRPVPPPRSDKEDPEIVERRLKDLGYF
jgi:predicted AlkP superfamily phosphohydrolase/phosphomutase